MEPLLNHSGGIGRLLENRVFRFKMNMEPLLYHPGENGRL